MTQILKTVLSVLILVLSISSYGQGADSTWSVLILKKGKEPVIRDNMASYSTSGFYLYHNCLYTFSLLNKKTKTGRLVGLKPDTLIFDMNGSTNYTLTVPVDSVKSFLLSDHWTPNQQKKVKANKHLFIFTKSDVAHSIPSKYAFITPDQERKYELIPSPTLNRICYYTYFEGHLLYHSGVEIDPPKYSDVEKEKALKAVLTVLDAVVNKRVIISVDKAKE